MLADGRAIAFNKNHQLIFNRRIYFEHLFLTSLLAILSGSCSELDIIKCQQSSKPPTLFVIF
jgi:hypothetical protein